MDSTTPTRGYCSGCRVERRLRFAGYASDGSENGIRPRAFYRSCSTCATTMLVLGDLPDAMSLVRNVIREWRRSTGADDGPAASPALRTIDFDDLSGELFVALWTLYGVWEPRRLSFTSYASGLLPRRIASYVRDAVGGDALYRHNGRSLVRVWPKAHATSVCDSIEGMESGRELDGDDGPYGGLGTTLNGRPSGAGRLAGSVGAVTADFAGDRSPDLGRILARRGR